MPAAFFEEFEKYNKLGVEASLFSFVVRRDLLLYFSFPGVFLRDGKETERRTPQASPSPPASSAPGRAITFPRSLTYR